LGYYINGANAARTGLLPQALKERIVSLGNTSLQGCVEALLDRDFMARAKTLASQCRILELSREPAFMDRFVDAMAFPTS
jgi:uncharacterized 2Fe-2S/4Fe-4S cluster protein (DUF4445 family)